MRSDSSDPSNFSFDITSQGFLTASAAFIPQFDLELEAVSIVVHSVCGRVRNCLSQRMMALATTPPR